MSDKKKVPKIELVITGIHDGVCEKCDDPVVGGYDAKIGKSHNFLCVECAKKRFLRRKAEVEDAARPLLKETNVVEGAASGRKVSVQPGNGVLAH